MASTAAMPSTRPASPNLKAFGYYWLFNWLHGRRIPLPPGRVNAAGPPSQLSPSRVNAPIPSPSEDVYRPCPMTSGGVSIKALAKLLA